MVRDCARLRICYEFHMSGITALLPDVETMFLTPSDQYHFISGRIGASRIMAATSQFSSLGESVEGERWALGAPDADAI